MSSMFNCGNVSLSVFGESHGMGIGAVLDGLPAGEPISTKKIEEFMSRRAPRSDGTSTARKEKDYPEIMSGLYNGKTAGTPIFALIRNTDKRSGDYSNLLFRPGHADYTGHVRYNGHNDPRGGGHFSGRVTAGIVFAGAVCGQILENRGITSGAHILSVGSIKDKPFDPVFVTADELNLVKTRYLPLLDETKDIQMRDEIDKARQGGDSIGGIVECAVTGIPAGIGSPMFDGLENVIARLVFAVPAVKGIEFGAGFAAARMKGSQCNDGFYYKDGKILTETNNNGGILGGISSGMPIIFRAAIKPTPSISVPQKTVDINKKTNAVLEIKGRHDPCIVPRAVPIIEAAVNIAIVSLL